MIIKLADLKLKSERRIFFFEKITGTLLIKEYNENNIADKKTTGIPKKIIDTIHLNNSPYLLKKNMLAHPINTNSFLVLIIFGRCLTYLTKVGFLLGTLFIHFGLRRFETSRDAINFYRKYIKPKNQNELCLSRAFFAAATSKRFKKGGVILIGIFLPSKSMHAWIIEDGALADSHDYIWLNYQPVAAMFYD